MISQLDHIAVAVRDLPSALAAYQGLLGREPLWVRNEDVGRQAWFQLRGPSLLLVAPSIQGGEVNLRLNQHGEGVWALAFAVADLAASRALFARRGLRNHGETPVPYELGPKDGRPLAAIDPQDTAAIPILLAPKRMQQSDLSAGAVGSIEALDHVVVRTDHPDRAAALYGARLGLDLRLDRSNAAWGARQLFFRSGASVVEVVASLGGDGRQEDDRFGGLAWRVSNADAVHHRLKQARFDISSVREGRKPGSRVLTVRSGVVGAPALIIEQGAQT